MGQVYAPEGSGSERRSAVASSSSTIEVHYRGNGSVIQLGLTEMEYLTAVRNQLGLGHDVLMDRPSESETGELCSPAPSSSRSGASTF